MANRPSLNLFNILPRSFKYLKRKGIGLLYRILTSLPYFSFILDTRESQTPITLKIWFFQKILGFNKRAYWPVHFTSKINIPENIYCGIETCPGYEPGCYIQGIGNIYIGDYTQIAQNVGIISSNHNIFENRKHLKGEKIVIGKYCWLGMNSVVLPGVKLGDFTIVGAGAIVTKSFPLGYCIIGGNPAKLIRKIDPEKCIRYKSNIEYNGYIPSKTFENFRTKKLRI